MELTGAFALADCRCAPVAPARVGWRKVASVALPVAAVAALALLVAERRDVFVGALQAAPVWLLAFVAALQLVALLARAEAWRICVRAACDRVSRRSVFHASGIGGLVGILNGQLGVAARLAALRRTSGSPRTGALVCTEVPILAVEAALAALTSFTLLGPLGLPWWSAVLCVSFAFVLMAGLSALARRRRSGVFAGLAVLRTLDGRGRVLAFVLVAVFAQIARNWLALEAIGVDVSVFDAVAVLIAMVALSTLPIGPAVGATAVVVILGSNGVALAAAAGVLLTATGLAGTLCFGGWALADRFRVVRAAPAV
ncbi:MAG TPA: hypothetical protein VN213_19765 [Solirubrobacteraceae bacterium]|nr:hypothetical protein [Solirubrobacteraceae bacterium]